MKQPWQAIQAISLAIIALALAGPPVVGFLQSRYDEWQAQQDEKRGLEKANAVCKQLLAQGSGWNSAHHDCMVKAWDGYERWKMLQLMTYK